MRKDSDGTLRPPEDPADFLRVAPELSEIVDFDFVPLMNKDSTNVIPKDWTTIAEAIFSRRDHGYQGFVVAHGTDTMHFSASAVAFALGRGLPFSVVFTGAQTIPEVQHGDARNNLIRACKVATEDIAEVVISFGDYVFRGCCAQKKDERRFDAFESPAFYPLAHVTEDILVHPLARRKADVDTEFDLSAEFEDGVLQVSLIPGLEPELVAPALENPACKGVILQSFGAGNVPNEGQFAFSQVIKQARGKQIPVLITSQFPANSTLHTSYEPGAAAVEAGAIPTGNMTSSCAGAKFRWVLARVDKRIRLGEIQGVDRLDAVKEMMQHVYIGEMNQTETEDRGDYSGRLSTDADDPLGNFLLKKSIPFLKVRNRDNVPVRGSSQTARARGIAQGQVAKTRVLRPPSSPDSWFVILVPGHRALDWKKIGAVTNAGKLACVDEDELKNIGVNVNSIPPYFNVAQRAYDKRRIALFIDEQLATQHVVDLSTGDQCVGYHLDHDALRRMIAELEMQVVNVSRASDFWFPYPLADRLSDREKKRQFELMLLLAMEDHAFCDAETAFLQDVASVSGISEAELDEWMSEISALPEKAWYRKEREVISGIGQDDEQADWTLFALCLLAHADEHFDRAQRIKIESWGGMLDVDVDTVESLISLSNLCHTRQDVYLKGISSTVRRRFQGVIDGIQSE
jgi:L-asparaginase